MKSLNRILLYLGYETLFSRKMDAIQLSLKERFKYIPEILFYRSLERAKTNGELFDILDSFPTQYPVVWDDHQRRWVHTEDLLHKNNFGKN